MSKATKQRDDEVISQNQVIMTTDYSRFNLLQGNRNVNQNHVKELQMLILQNGNLTGEFPIVVDKDFNVIDGQHRLEALKGLGWEVGYIQQDNATIETVRAINRGSRNWTWQDVALSYSKLGYKDYQWLLDFAQHFDLRFTPAMRLVRQKADRRIRGAFMSGEMVIDPQHKAKAHDKASRLNAICAMLEKTTGDFQNAVIEVVESPIYDHDRMMQKLRLNSDMLSDKATKSDYMRQLEKIYNRNVSEENRVRLY